MYSVRGAKREGTPLALYNRKLSNLFQDPEETLREYIEKGLLCRSIRKGEEELASDVCGETILAHRRVARLLAHGTTSTLGRCDWPRNPAVASRVKASLHHRHQT